MADELSIVVKTVLEVDEAESKRRIGEARDKILKSGNEIKLTADIKRQEFQKNLKDAIASAEKSVAKTPFKFGVDIKRQEFQQNLKDAIKSAQKVVANSVKVSIGVDEAASLKQIDKYIEEAKKKLNNAKLDLNINSNLVRNEDKANKNGKKTKPASWKSNPQNIEGGKRYREALEDTIKANEHIFKDKNMKRSSVSYFISPKDEQVKAIVEYSDGLGKTASMMLTAKKAAKGSEKVLEGIQVKQLKVVDSQEKYNKALAQQTKEAERQKAIQQKAQQKADEKYSKKEESSANWLNQQENAFKNLYSKAFNQKNPLTDGFRAEAEEALAEYASALDELKKAGGIFTGDQKRNIADLREYAKRAIDEQRSSQYGQADLGAKDVSSQRKIREIEIGDEIKKLKDLGLYTGKIEESFRELNNEISKIDDFKALQDWQDRFRVARLEADKLLESVQGLAAKQAIGIEGKQIPQIDSYLSNESIKDGKTDGIVALRNALEKLKQEYVDLQQKFKQDNLDENQYAALQVNLKELDTQLRKTANSAKMFDGSMKSNEVLERLNAAKSKLKTDFEKMKFDWSKALEIPELKRQIDEMERALESVDEVNLRNVQNQFKQLQANIRLAKADTKSFGTQIKDLFVKFQQYFSVADIIRETTQAIGKMSENVKVLNSAMTELKKVTDLTEQGYDEFVSSSADRAIDIGTGLSDYVEGVADFVKLGESMTDAIEKSEAANVLYKVGDGFNSIEDSTNVVITSLKAYKKEALSATNVIDKLNEVSNRTSITTAGLSDALTRSASALALSGLSMDKSIALAVAGNETTRNASMTGKGIARCCSNAA